MEKFLEIALGFLLTGLLGKWLAQAWQNRAWLLQQRFTGREREYNDLRDLSAELAGLLAVRIYCTQRLMFSLFSGKNASESTDQQISAMRTIHDEYQDAIVQWNKRLATYYIRLPLLASYQMANDLEQLIQKPLVSVTADLDRQWTAFLVQNRLSATAYRDIDQRISSLQGRSIDFSKRLLLQLRAMRTDVYYGRPIKFSYENLNKFSTWFLFKALFVRDVNSLSVVRAPLDS